MAAARPIPAVRALSRPSLAAFSLSLRLYSRRLLAVKGIAETFFGDGRYFFLAFY
jgi:hypothetical protein